MKSIIALESKSTIRFNAKLAQPKAAGKAGSAAVLTLPKSKSAQLPLLRVTMIEGTINGFPFRAPLARNGSGSHSLKVDKALRSAAGGDSVDTFAVEITRAGDEPEIRMPADLRKALAASRAARAMWEKITPIARRDWILNITSAKQTGTRKRRVEKTCSMLASGKPRICCFGGLNWLRKDHPAAAEAWAPLPTSKV